MKWFGKVASVPESDPPLSDNRSVGSLGEEIAFNFLTTRGYRILERNFRCKGGEVDIIARHSADKSLDFI
jgi:putative endonuclease